MKRTAVQRKTPLTRDKPMRRGAPRRIARETLAEQQHKVAIRAYGTCAARGILPAVECSPPLECAHLGSGGMGQKRGDWTETTMLCRGHHRAWDEHRGPFLRWTRERRQEQAAKWIREAREFVAHVLDATDSPF